MIDMDDHDKVDLIKITGWICYLDKILINKTKLFLKKRFRTGTFWILQLDLTCQLHACRWVQTGNHT